MDRRDVTFDSGGERCAAWLYTPDTPGPHPIVVMAHGFGAVRAARLWAFAERFAAAGLAALVFDYRYFGDSGGEPRQLLDVSRQLDDWRAAIAFARSLDGVDPERVAAWGSSFGGGGLAGSVPRRPVGTARSRADEHRAAHGGRPARRGAAPARAPAVHDPDRRAAGEAGRDEQP
jgi:dienelactone hydrolase